MVTKEDVPAQGASGAATIEGALAMLREGGGRVTSSRRFLLRALFDGEKHHTAEGLAKVIQEKMPDVHISTIYRNLDDLEKIGVITHSHLGHGPATYHLAADAHGHFVCESCGKMIEAPDSLFAGLRSDAEEQFGFAIDPHHFGVLGLCSNCRPTTRVDASDMQ
jgi:Fur family ferric uptake transcriptional regulator